MSAHIAKQPSRLFTPNSLAYGASSVQGRRGVSVFERLAGAARWVADYSRRKATIGELERLSDRELADIGLVRSEVRRIFER